jgi:hypothetical protein
MFHFSFKMLGFGSKMVNLGFKLLRFGFKLLGSSLEMLRLASEHAFAHLPLSELGLTCTPQLSLGHLDASRTDIRHPVMYTTPSVPTMLSHTV